MLKVNKKSLALGTIILLALIIILVYFMLPQIKPVRLAASCTRQSILLVPLDSRPVCSSLPQKLGQLAGLNVILPPKAYLDNYKTPANKEKLRQWLRSSSHFYKDNIISADMLLHGSLLQARQSISTQDEENNLLHELADLTKSEQINSSSDNKYTIFSVIPRLLVSDELLPDRWYQYQLLRYSELADMVRISGSFALTRKLRALEKTIPSQVLNKYISQYRQSDRFNTNLLTLTQKNPNLQLIIGQDDASPIGLPHASADRLQALIKSNALTKKTQFTYGADEIAALLIARTHLNHSKWQPKIFIKYSSEKASSKHMPYMAVTTDTALRNQIDIIGAQITDDIQAADIVCYVNCGSDEQLPGKKQAQEVQQLLNAGCKVAVIDSSEDYEAQQLLLPQLLRCNVPLSQLAAYAGWNTFSNSSGTALAQAVIFASRLHELKQANAAGEQIAALYAENLNFTAERILEDFYYQKTIHPYLRQELTALGIDPTSLSAAEKLQTEQKIQAKLALNAFTLLYSNLGRTPFYRQDSKKYYLTDIAVGASLPWNRIFEVDLNVWTHIGIK